KQIRQREQQSDHEHERDQHVFPAREFQHELATFRKQAWAMKAQAPQALLSVPLGMSCVIWLFCTLMRTPSAISSVTKVSFTSMMRPRMPPVVTTSSPPARRDSIACCSFMRFCCGRISRK